MNATRRHLLTASIGFATPFVRPDGIHPAGIRLAGIGSSAAGAARHGLTFGAYGGLFQELYEPFVVDPFSQTHPDIGVFYAPAPAPAQILATLRRQRDNPELDVVLLDLASARIATDEGLLEPLPAGSLPALAELAPSATFPGIAGRALFTEPLVLLFDAARVRPPQTWKSLWAGLEEPALAIPAPPQSIGIAFTLVAGRLFSGGSEQRAAENGVTAISELSRGIITWDPRPDVYHVVGDGGARIGVGWNMPAQVYSDRMGGRLGVVFPGEGTISRVTTVSLVKGSRQPDTARTFISWLLGAEAQKTMVERMYLGPVNAKARYIEGALQRTANTPDRVARAMPVDWVVVSTIREEIIRRWREVIPGAG